MAVRHRVHCSDTERDVKWGSGVHEGWMQTYVMRRACWCWLNLSDMGKAHLKGHLPAVLGKTAVRNDREWWKRRHHSKPLPRHHLTRPVEGGRKKRR